METAYRIHRRCQGPHWPARGSRAKYDPSDHTCGIPESWKCTQKKQIDVERWDKFHEQKAARKKTEKSVIGTYPPPPPPPFILSFVQKQPGRQVITHWKNLSRVQIKMSIKRTEKKLTRLRVSQRRRSFLSAPSMEWSFSPSMAARPSSFELMVMTLQIPNQIKAIPKKVERKKTDSTTMGMNKGTRNKNQSRLERWKKKHLPRTCGIAFLQTE